jgi:hypothetical protein
MKIALMVDRMTGFSGVELYTLDLGLALQAAGHQAKVYAAEWGPTLMEPLQSLGVETRLFEHSIDADVCLTPLDRPMYVTHQSGLPYVHVIHGDDPYNTPREHPRLRGIVTIRTSQQRLIPPDLARLPAATIRNPIGFHRAGTGALSETEPEWAGVLVSEFDDMKCDLARRYQQHVQGPVLLVGSWYSTQQVPADCTWIPGTLDVWGYYRGSASACSYRLSRQLPEAAYCRIPTWVYGGLEPHTLMSEDRPDDWTLVTPDAVPLDEFRYETVAARWTDLLERAV